jgi:hypothetical protein
VFDTKAADMRLQAIGLKTDEVSQILALIQKWVESSGEEWTVGRIKAIKLDLLRVVSGLEPLKSHTWIHYNKSGVPKGPFGRVFRLALTFKGFPKAWNAIMVYTGLSFDHPEMAVTDKQWEKAVKAIRRSPVKPEALVEGLKWVHESPLNLQVEVKSQTGEPIIYQTLSDRRRAPDFDHTVPESEGVIRSLSTLVRTTNWTVQNWDILAGAVRGLEDFVVPDLDLNLEFEEKAKGPREIESPEMGIIATIQEGGYKLRFAANPYRVFQSALEPLKLALFAALRRIPNDFTFDQSAGIEFIQDQLARGCESVSMDLSNATDNAPLDLQLEMLSRYGVPTRWLQFFRDCCRGTWLISKYRKPKPWQYVKMSWTVGSPLGLGPTFASFALWHHNMVQGCFAELGVRPSKSHPLPYAILGDDVWIGDRRVAALYRSRMTILGVPIAEEKSLVAEGVGEFAGRVITPNRVVQGIKWKGRATDKSFVDLVRNIGPGALILLKPRQRAVINYIADLPQPYGLGWNPLGIPLEERFPAWLERAMSRDERVRSYSSRASRINRILYTHRNITSDDARRKPCVEDLASDQDAMELVQTLLPGLEPRAELWPNMVEVGLSKMTELPTMLQDKLKLFLLRNTSMETCEMSPTLVLLERKIRRSVTWSHTS